MKNIFKNVNRIDKKIHDMKQIKEYLDKVESIKRDFQNPCMSFNCYFIK